MKFPMKTRIFSLVLALFAAVVFSAVCFAESSLITKTTTVQSKTRTYYVYQPEACKVKSCPLVIMFHGLNPLPGQVDAALATAQSYGWQATADRNEFVVVFPSALSLVPKSFYGVQYDPPSALGSGNSQRWDIAPITLFGYTFKATQDTEFVSAIIKEMAANFKTLTTHVFATGHSHGAFFSYYATMYLNKVGSSKVVQAFASHSGGLASYYGVYWPPRPWDAKSLQSKVAAGLIIFSGNDPIVSPTWTKALYNDLIAKKHKATLDEIKPGIGHAWDLTRNQKQWDFFVANSPALPKPPVKVSFAAASGSGRESAGGTNVVVGLSGAGNDVVNVLLEVSGASTAVDGVDFNLSGKSLSFAVGETSKVVRLDVMADDVVESDENVVLGLKVVSGNAVAGSVVKYTYTIVDDTVVPPPPPVEPPPVEPPPVVPPADLSHLWVSRFLTMMFNNVVLVWEKSADALYSAMYDDGASVKNFAFGPYAGVRVLDTEGSWKSPYYLWAVWADGTGKFGLYRKAGNLDPAFDKVAYLTRQENWKYRSFSLSAGGTPFVLWADLDNADNAVVSKFSVDGALVGNSFYTSPVTGIEMVARYVAADKYGLARIVWVDLNEDFAISGEGVAPQGGAGSDVAVLDAPGGYKVADFAVGYLDNDQLSRVLLTGDGVASVWKVDGNGVVVGDFDFVAPEGFEFVKIATSVDGKINLLLSDKDGQVAKVWKVNAGTGVKEGEKSYGM